MFRLVIVLITLFLCSSVCIPRAEGTSTVNSDGRSSSKSPSTAGFKGATGLSAPGEVIVKVKGSSADRLQAKAADNLSRVSRLIQDSAIEYQPASIDSLMGGVPAGGLAEITAKRGLDRIFVLKFDPGIDVDAVVAKLNATGEVEYAEPNYLVQTAGQAPQPTGPKDLYFSQQWGLYNSGLGVYGNSATRYDDIDALDAWNITTGSASVIVAVVDTGMDVTHPDLAANVYTNPGPPPSTGYNVANNNTDVSDVLGHGTEMAGIIGAVTNNGIGISGISQSQVMPVKFFSQTGSSSIDTQGTVANAAKGVLYAVSAGASIINASWDALFLPGQFSAGEPQALKDACLSANDAGVLMVCIAGNEGYDNDYTAVYPGHYELPNQIVVAASDYNDEIWHVGDTLNEVQTGYGPNTVQLAAPGVSILTTQARGSCELCTASQNPADWYAVIDGTSASAAFVSGVAALVKSQYPEATAPVLRRRILESVDVLPGLQGYVYTGGRLNAYKALTINLQVTPPILKSIKYKAGAQTLVLSGELFQQGAHAVVGGVAYLAKATGTNSSPVAAKVPATAFPPGVSVPVFLRNPDGGVSATMNLQR
jgi:subtilisin family serine protease